MASAYLDPRSGQTFPLGAPRWSGPGHAPLLLMPLPGITTAQIDTTKRSLWRYRAALPMQPDTPISMGEGCTPLIRRDIGNATALIKCEWMMPTGSFKDRGASVMLSLLRAQGIGEVLEDSSGNGGAAVAAYAAAGGMRAIILTPASTSPAKTVQMRACGATVELVPGSRQDTADEALRRADSVFYASHNWHPFFLQGTKTLAYELWEDLGFHAPDNVIVPCGAGSNVLGCEIGFSELLRAGQIDAMPRIFAVQPANCAPIAAAFLAGEETAATREVLPTIAEGTAIAAPIRLHEVLGALRETQGGAVMLSEAEIVQATFDLARIGVYVEPTAAQPAAAF
ncbi:MAG TPA: pyridoxal-phosphate dependent enzyme, partial [Gemmataceae bacterium]|nr:pyridoxal-phosphate dependent enzyme [Gemmataceae bacterium]